MNGLTRDPSRLTTILVGSALWLAYTVFSGSAGAQEPTPVRVGSKSFTEGIILGEIATLTLERQGIPVTHQANIGDATTFHALVRGDIDLYADYTGTLRGSVYANRNLSNDRELREALADDGVRMTDTLGFQNSFALGTTREVAQKYRLRTIGDLRGHPELRLGFTETFINRGDGWPSLKQAYDLPQRNPRGLSHDLAYAGLVNGKLDVIDMYTTDAEIVKYDLVSLEDDRGHFVEYRAVIVYRADLANRSPETITALESLIGTISEQEMRRANAAVKIDEKTERQAAADFLDQEFGLDIQVEAPSIGGELWDRTVEHLTLVGVAMLGGILVAVPLGILAQKEPRSGRFILGFVGILQTVPALALLALFVPILGIGAETAIVTLFCYSMLPIVRNTHAGLASVDPDLHEVADAIGLTPGQKLRKVELPLAYPTILAGIKTATVMIIGFATLGAFVGAGGYGEPILAGIRSQNVRLILLGAVPAALMAVGSELLFDLSERALRSRRPRTA